MADNTDSLDYNYMQCDGLYCYPALMKKTEYQFQYIPKSWAKRRKAAPEPQPISIQIPDFELKEQHFCNMYVTFDDGRKEVFYSRVLCNHITKQWTVDGMHIAVKVLEVG